MGTYSGHSHAVDRFLLGGASTLRGFGLWGVGPRERGERGRKGGREGEMERKRGREGGGEGWEETDKENGRVPSLYIIMMCEISAVIPSPPPPPSLFLSLSLSPSLPPSLPPFLPSSLPTSHPPSLPPSFLPSSIPPSLPPSPSGFSRGGEAYWATGAHLYLPLPLVRNELIRRIRIHSFLTAGNLITMSMCYTIIIIIIIIMCLHCIKHN